MEKIRGKHFGGTDCRLSRFTAVALAWGLVGVSCLHAQQSNPTEYQVKAAYLYNFGKFIEWPAKVNDSGESFTICVLGQDPFGTALDRTIAGESINGRKVAIKRIAKPMDALVCRILFISSTEENRLKEILAIIDKTSILTVSDIPHFTQRGGMIQFIIEANRVRFEVNLTNSELVGLTLSSQLLKVAASVRKNGRSGD